MHKLYVGLGSNIGNRKDLIERALLLLADRIGVVERVSSMVETEPWGFESSNKFLNAAALIRTNLSPMCCLEETKHIEQLLGRSHKSVNGHYQDRPIDIDLLHYDMLHLNTSELILPHPLIKKRDFVLFPLLEIW